VGSQGASFNLKNSPPIEGQVFLSLIGSNPLKLEVDKCPPLIGENPLHSHEEKCPFGIDGNPLH